MLLEQPLRGPLDVDVLQRCLIEIARRHDTLRTTLDASQGSPRQVVADEVVDVGRRLHLK